MRVVRTLIMMSHRLLVAAKAMAASAVDIYLDPAIVEAAREDFEERHQAYPFASLLPDREVPSLNKVWTAGVAWSRGCRDSYQPAKQANIL